MEQEAVKKENGLMFVKFENQKVPEFKQVRGKDWIYWGEKNDYPDYLIDLYMRSSTHNAIITGKVNYIIGNGWKSDKVGSTINNQAILNAFINKINANETLNELSESVVLDFEIFNGITLEVIWNKSGRDFELHHIPFNKIRTNENQDKYYYSKDWSNIQQSEEKTGLKEYLPFDPEIKKGSSIFVYQITAPRKGKDPNVYSMPEYIGSTQAIETDLECSNYNLSEIKTGFSAGTILNFYNGIPEPEKKKEIEKQIKDKFSGTDRAGGIIINFADGKDRGSEVVSLSGNDLDKRYIELKKDVRQEIFTGHKVSSPMLFGVKTEGQLGGRTEIVEAYELFQNTYISRRQMILEKIFNKFAKLKNISGKLMLSPTVAIGYGIPDSLIAQAMPIDFVKEKLGIPIKKENESADAKQVINAINSLSPLVANKVLESMSAEESRGLVGLTGGLVTTVTTTQTDTQMSAHKKMEEDILLGFSKIGRSKDLFHFIKSKEIDFKTDLEFIESELQIFKEKDDDEIISPKIAPKIGIKIEVLYSYELRSNAPALVPGGESREFCKELIQRNFLYSRQEIDMLSNEFGTDVWRYKGGWYTNPNTDAPTPQCRHIWQQHIVKSK